MTQRRRKSDTVRYSHTHNAPGRLRLRTNDATICVLCIEVGAVNDKHYPRCQIAHALVVIKMME